MQEVIIFAFGIAVGFIFAAIFRRAKSVGSLRIDTSDPDGMYFFLEIDKGKLNTLLSEKYVMVRTYLSRSGSQK